MIFSHDMDALLFPLAALGVMAGLIGYALRGEKIGSVAVEQGGSRRCGLVEIEPDFHTGEGSVMRMSFLGWMNEPLLKHSWRLFSDPRHGQRLLLTRSQANAVAALVPHATTGRNE
jgi:hypothetical protein